MHDCAPPRDLAAIFNDFAAGEINCPAKSEGYFEGSVLRHEFYCEPRNTPARMVWPSLPGIDEELFEWITLCDAIRAARGSFTLHQGRRRRRQVHGQRAALAAAVFKRSKPWWSRPSRRTAEWALLNMATSEPSASCTPTHAAGSSKENR
jgi:hypothetical protein